MYELQYFTQKDSKKCSATAASTGTGSVYQGCSSGKRVGCEYKGNNAHFQNSDELYCF